MARRNANHSVIVGAVLGVGVENPIRHGRAELVGCCCCVLMCRSSATTADGRTSVGRRDPVPSLTSGWSLAPRLIGDRCPRVKRSHGPSSRVIRTHAGKDAHCDVDGRAGDRRTRRPMAARFRIRQSPSRAEIPAATSSTRPSTPRSRNTALFRRRLLDQMLPTLPPKPMRDRHRER